MPHSGETAETAQVDRSGASGYVPPQRLRLGVLATPDAAAAAEAVERRPSPLSRRLKRFAGIVLALDVLVMVLSNGIAWALRELIPGASGWSVDGVQLSLGVMPAIIITWVALLFLKGAYARRTFGAGAEEFRSVSNATALAALITASAAWFTASDVSRAFLALLFAVGLVLLLAERWAVRRWIHQRRIGGELSNRVLLVGSASAVTRLGGLLDDLPHLGYHVVACTLTEPMRVVSGLPAPAVGSTLDIGETAVRLGVDTVMVAGGSETELRDVGWALEGRQVDLVVVPHLAEVAGSRMKMRPIGGLPLLHVEEPQALRAGEWPKRVFDIVGATTALLLALPTMLVAALAIKLTDRGPIFYRQERIGLDGEKFLLWKFRSMHVDADKIDADLRAQHGHTEGIFKLTEDPRITRVGSFLRRYSIDELPQLFNVLNGTMSLVGPRPHRQHEVDTYTPVARRRLAVRPGMTGLWQVSGRSNLAWEDAVRMDLYYRDNWSLMWDVWIILKTVRAVLAREGAY